MNKFIEVTTRFNSKVSINREYVVAFYEVAQGGTGIELINHTEDEMLEVQEGYKEVSFLLGGTNG